MSESANPQQAQAKVLRIGIIQGDRIVSERLIKPGQSVTIGQDPKSTFVVAAEGVPKKVPMFVARGDGYRLQFSDEMEGVLAVSGAKTTLKDLQAKATKGEFFEIAIDESSRGKLNIGGGVTVLFQFVAAPPEPAKVTIQTDFRPKLIQDEDDPFFLASLGFWSSVGAVLMVYVWNTEPIERTNVEIPERFLAVMQPPPVEPKPDEPKPDEPEELDEMDGTQIKKEQKKDPNDGPAPKTEREAKVREAKQAEAKRQDAIQRSAMLTALIGTTGANNNGSTVANLFEGDSQFTGNLDAALQGVSGEVAVADGGPVGPRSGTGSGGRGDASVGEVGKGGGGSSSVSSVASAAPRKGSIRTETVEVASGEGADKVRDVIKKNSGQIKACYDQRLKENPNLAGRLVVDFDITGGRVTSVGISTNTTGDKGLEDCVKSRVRGWRFDPSVEDAVSFPFSLTTQ